MNNDNYLKAILSRQTLREGSEELKALQAHRADVEELLLKYFASSSPTIRYGGSKAKGTMIRESYDLDIICYFPSDESDAGDTLEQIYNKVKEALSYSYFVEPKTSALRLKSKGGLLNAGIDFHIDVVPGRFTGTDKSDAFLHRTEGNKARLKTNIDVHITHVRDSGYVDVIRLLKLWKYHNGITLKNFVFELAVIKLLTGKGKTTLSSQLEYVLAQFSGGIQGLSVEDPANPQGNDLSEALNAAKASISAAASNSLSQIEPQGWEALFGTVGLIDAPRVEALQRAAAAVTTPTKPWCN